MAKRCKYSDKKTGVCSCEKFYRDKDGISHCVMEPYTTDNCNMKRKSKLRRVKAWAHKHNDGKMELFTVNCDRTYYTIPCTILIEEKYLKEQKK